MNTIDKTPKTTHTPDINRALQADEIITACGCTISTLGEHGALEGVIYYCPQHANVQELLVALELAKATIERLTPQHGPFNSSQGTLDVINKAIAKAEGRL